MNNPKILAEKVFNKALNILFPLQCAFCNTRGEALCVQCFSKIEEPMVPKEENFFVSAGYHDPVIQEAIQKLKYEGYKPVAELLAKLIYERIFKKELAFTLGEKDVMIIPIPIHKKRLRERGFNQAELIAYYLIKMIIFDNPVWEEKMTLEKKLLKKIKHTESQVLTSGRTERLQNLAGTMEAERNETLKNKDIILVDDVSTTGATIKEAVRALRVAGAKRIFAVVVAK